MMPPSVQARALSAGAVWHPWQRWFHAEGKQLFDALVADHNIDRVRFPGGLALTGLVTASACPADGWLWHNASTRQLCARLNGMTCILAEQDVPWITPATGGYALTTCGASSAATGAVGRGGRPYGPIPFHPPRSPQYRPTDCEHHDADRRRPRYQPGPDHALRARSTKILTPFIMRSNGLGAAAGPKARSIA